MYSKCTPCDGSFKRFAHFNCRDFYKIPAAGILHDHEKESQQRTTRFNRSAHGLQCSNDTSVQQCQRPPPRTYLYCSSLYIGCSKPARRSLAHLTNSAAAFGRRVASDHPFLLCQPMQSGDCSQNLVHTSSICQKQSFCFKC
jgi:hypothetical protein